MQQLSNTTEILIKHLIETVTMNAINCSINETEEDKESKLDDDNMREDTSSEAYPQIQPQYVSQTNMNITQILQQVAELAENLRDDMKNIQIGDYVISMNASPLEIQLKQAISSFQLANNESGNKVMDSKGEGDGNGHDPIHETISMNNTNDKQLSHTLSALSPSSSSSSALPVCNAMMTLNAIGTQLEIDHRVTKNLKEKKKCMTLGERIRKIFRLTFNRRRNK